MLEDTLSEILFVHLSTLGVFCWTDFLLEYPARVWKGFFRRSTVCPLLHLFVVLLHRDLGRRDISRSFQLLRSPIILIVDDGRNN